MLSDQLKRHARHARHAIILTMESQTEPRRKKTYVYVIGAVGLTAVKIGTARDPAARLRDMQIGSPVRLAIVWTREWWSTTGGAPLEKALHRKFAEHRLHGEWFDLGLDPVPAVRTAIAELISLGLPPELTVNLPTRVYRKSELELDSEETLRVLRDLAEIFTQTGAQRMFTADLAEHLRERGDPYTESNNRKLCILITRYLGESQAMTIGPRRARGYHADLAIARWQRASRELTAVTS